MVGGPRARSSDVGNRMRTVPRAWPVRYTHRTHGNCYADTDSYIPNRYPCPLTDIDSDSNVYAHTDTYIDSDSNVYAHTDTYSDSDSPVYAHTDTYSDSDSPDCYV